MASAEESTVKTSGALTFSVTANFTAEPLAEFLRFWLARLTWSDARLAFSDYNHIFQELIVPGGVSPSKTPGVNFFLVRFEDWARDHEEPRRAGALVSAAHDFNEALASFAQRAFRPTLLVFCPSSTGASLDPQLRDTIQSLQSESQRQAAKLRGITVITPDEISDLYPVAAIDDPEADRQAHIPFTRAYFAALATVLARKTRSLLQPPAKVVVVDADNTLWDGVVGEVGAQQVQVGPERQALQAFLRKKKEQGMLLALISKNEEYDVAEVFRRPDMLLRREDFVAWKVNWEPKSRNVAILGRDLELGQNSFIFIDDNPVECADVSANCPNVTTLLLPQEVVQIPAFLKHVWAFDTGSTTAVDRQRTELYRQQTKRNQFRSAATTFREFIHGLQLKVSAAPPSAKEYERAAQLTQRTNQFNNTGIRRTVAELSALLESGERRALVLRVSDRFGDYGEVGLAIFFTRGEVLYVETLLMSCRVLGKGVEHRFVASLGEEALRLGATQVEIPFKRTERNQPAEKFLRSIHATVADSGSFCLSATQAAALTFNPEDITSTEADEQVSEESKKSDRQFARPDFCQIAVEFSSVDGIVAAVSKQLTSNRPQLPHELVLPRDSDEEKLAKIWSDVLHVEPVGVTDSFLSLGGKSLHAVSIASRVTTEFGVRVPLLFILSNPTIAGLAEEIRRGQHRSEGFELARSTELSLSPAQQRLRFLDEFIPYRAAYNIVVGRRLHGHVDLAALEKALSQVVRRHEVLRSTFPSSDGLTGLKISETSDVSIRHVRGSSEPEATKVAEEEARCPFDLATGPLVRCLVVSWSAEDHLLVLNVHHIVADGWSIGIMLRDLSLAYAAERPGQASSWQPLPNSYADYAAWQKTRLAANDFRDDLAYWKQELEDAPSLLELPADKPRPAVMTYVGGCVQERISARVRAGVEKLAQRQQCTPFVVLLAAFRNFLQRYTQQDDIVVGVPVAGRNHPATESLVGCFVNTLAIRTSVEPDASFLKSLEAVRAKVFEALAHQELPFESLVSELGLQRDLSRSPLFQVMLVLQDTPESDLALPGINVEKVALHNGGAKFDLVLEITPTAAGYELALEFNSSLFLPETSARMLRHFGHLLASACEAPEWSVATLPLLDEGEVEAMILFANGGSSTVDAEDCLHQSFERRTAMNPQAIAVSCDAANLSYAQLNQRANQLAHYLISVGVGSEVLVGLCVERSIDLVVAILAILKAGGAYLPIDLSYPADRVAFMLEDAQVGVLLTQKTLVSSLPKHRSRTICLDEIDQVLSAQPATNPQTAVKPENLAYVIYTSGSTGKPKGCMITHRNVVRLMRATEPWFAFNERDVWTLFHSSAFDFSVWEIWGALFYGGRLVVVPFIVTRSPEAFYELLAREQVTVLNQTPSAFRQLIQAEESVGQRKLALRYVVFGGEALEMQSLQPWFDRHGDQTPKLINMYGITETTVHVTYRPLSRQDLSSSSVIGMPIPDLRLYILDRKLQPAPIGVPGELYVGGAGLARGYLNRPELTSERFISDHLTKAPGSRLYKTGDRARFLANGDVEYLGRIDEQVKIRGFRIELGEIESVLRQHSAVREVSVMAREDVPGAKRLVAYLVVSAPAPDVNALRDHLKHKLPDYMVPAAFVFLDRLPLTNNGKIDRKKLPVPEQQRPEMGSTYVAPRNVNEEKLAAIWSKVLRVERIGINDNFFELGGDSILSIQIISLARREGLKITPKLLFAHQTVAGLAAVAEVAENAGGKEEVVSGDVPLTPIEHWFFEQNLEEPHHYNQAFMFEVAEKMDRLLLEAALKEVSRHHDALRLRFAREGNRWRQFYSAADDAPVLQWMSLGRLPADAQRQSIESAAISTEAGLNLEHGPLWRVAYFSLDSAEPDRMLIVVHHLAVDGVSWRPLLEDLEMAYQQLKSGRAVQLPAKTTSYKSWAQRLMNYAGGKSLRDELPFWRKAAEGNVEASTAKLFGQSAGTDQQTEGSSVIYKLSLTEAETLTLLQRIPAAYNSQINDVLLTALARAWTICAGSRVLFTNLEGHGRESLFDEVDLSRTVGWFTSIFPVRIEIPESSRDWQPGEALKSVKEQLLQIPQRGVGYGILRYLSGDTSLAGHSEPPILFNYLGQFDQVTSGSNLFRFARESSGPWHSPKQHRRFPLEINCVVVANRLEVACTCNPDGEIPAMAARLADEFASALRELIARCSAPEAKGRTPSDFPLAKLDQQTLDRLLAENPDLEDVYPLSPIQTLFFSANPEGPGSAFDQWYCTLRGPLNVPAFQRAWQETLRRHPILRSTIHGEGLREPLQFVHGETRLPWKIEDWRGDSSDRQAQRWLDFLKEDRATALSLAAAPAMRFALIRLSEDTWKFVWSVPPLLLDGWSWPIVYRDANRLYQAFSQGLSPKLEPGCGYRSYIEWLGKQSSGEARAFWREYLAGFKSPISFPSDSPEPNGHAGTANYIDHRVELSPEATSALNATARGLHITLSTLLLAVWSLQLNRQLNHPSGASDIVFGAAFSGRPADLPGVESIVGPFVNNLPMRVAVAGDAKLGAFLKHFHAQSLKLSSHQFTPLMEIQACSEVPWKHRLFDNVVVFQNYLVDESARNFGKEIRVDDFVGPVHTNYPVMFLVEPGDSLHFTLIYDGRLIARQTIECWGRDLALLLERLPHSLETRVLELQSLLSPPPASPARAKLRLRAESQNFVPPQTDMERAISGVWQGLFGLDRISIEDNFFDLGGHSLLLVQMHNRLRETLHTEFPVVTLFEYPTVRLLARHLDKAAVAAGEPGVKESARDRAQRQKRAMEELRSKLGKS